MELPKKNKAEQFKRLHEGPDILCLPNIWDPLGAALLESLGYAAVATASASIAWTNGYHDGERIPFNELLLRLRKISASISVPLSADVESGYADSESTLAENIEQLIGTGIAGINLEDYDTYRDGLYSIDKQCRRIGIVRKVAQAMNVPLFINARTDVYLRGTRFVTGEEKLNETLRRGRAYLEAGADGLFPPGMKDQVQLAQVVNTLGCPVNVIAHPGIPDLKTLKEIGVARVSLGPGFLKIAFKAMKDLARRLKNQEGLEDVIRNDVSSEELKQLVNSMSRN